MSPITIRPPGDVVNEIYAQSIKLIIEMSLGAGDDPIILVEEIKYELQKMVTEMMSEDDALLERKRAEMAPIRARYESLYHELHPDKPCPQYGSTLPVLLALRTYVDEHKKLKDEHEKLLASEVDIRREEKQLCNELNEHSLQDDNHNFKPKQLIAQISLLSEHIAELREEKTKRIGHLSEILRTLHELEEVYGWKRPTIESMIGRLISLGPINIDRFPLTKEAIELVDKEFSQITEKVQKAEATFEQSHKQLAILMRKHQSLRPNDKAVAITKFRQCRLSKLPDLIAEVNRFKEYGVEKLTNEISKTRERIHFILNKLSYNDVTNDPKYAILFTNDFTEDIYFMHEELLQELEAQYEINKTMYEQIEAWNVLFLEFQEFEKNATDPQRFHRRGYSALAEEKNRRKLEASLRECESRLQNLADDFMAKNGQPFLMGTNGQQIADYIQQRKDDYVKTKEREREAAKAALGHKATGSSTAMRTPLKVKQLADYPSSVSSKRTTPTSTTRTPLKSVGRTAALQLPTGKTPLFNSTMKLRSQKLLQTTKRTHPDKTLSTAATPAKQRCLVNQIMDTTANVTSLNALPSNTSTGFKVSSTITTTPGKRQVTKRAIPTPIRTYKAAK